MMEMMNPYTETSGTIEPAEMYSRAADNFVIRPVVELQLLPSAGDAESVRYVRRTAADVSEFMLNKPA